MVTVALASAVTVVLALLATWFVGRALGRFNVVDVTWGLGFVLVAWVSMLVSIGDGDATRRVVVAALVSVWGLRLAAHIAWRSRGQGEDPRYTAMFDASGRSPGRHALLVVYPVQAIALWFVSLPVQVVMVADSTPNALLVIGAAIWAVGFTFESVGDHQLARFRADPANEGAVMDRGLWRYTRHPNYFGDACVWWGLWIIAAQELPGALTVLSPIVMTFLLARGSGKPILERSLRERRPGYADYVERTSGFFPLPPRARVPSSSRSTSGSG